MNKITKTISVNGKKWKRFKRYCYERGLSPSSRLSQFIDKFLNIGIDIDIANFDITKPIEHKKRVSISVFEGRYNEFKDRIYSINELLSPSFLFRRFIDIEVLEMKKIHIQKSLYSEAQFKKDFQLEGEE